MDTIIQPVEGGRWKTFRWIGAGIVIVCLLAVVVSFFWKSVRTVTDPRLVQALALVQNHPARSAPSIRQAVEALLQDNHKFGRVPSMSAWTVEMNQHTTNHEGYVVKVAIRLPSERADRWIEWQYLWLVRLPTSEVVPLSRPAAEVMP